MADVPTLSAPQIKQRAANPVRMPRASEILAADERRETSERLRRGAEETRDAE